eukprot:gene9150-biopygen634
MLHISVPDAFVPWLLVPLPANEGLRQAPQTGVRYLFGGDNIELLSEWVIRKKRSMSWRAHHAVLWHHHRRRFGSGVSCQHSANTLPSQ